MAQCGDTTRRHRISPYQYCLCPTNPPTAPNDMCVITIHTAPVLGRWWHQNPASGISSRFLLELGILYSFLHTSPHLSIQHSAFRYLSYYNLAQCLTTNPNPSASSPKSPSCSIRPRTTPSRQRSCRNATVRGHISPHMSERKENADDIYYSGTDPSRPTLVAIKGTVFDVSKNAAYSPSGQYHGTYIP